MDRRHVRGAAHCAIALLVATLAACGGGNGGQAIGASEGVTEKPNVIVFNDSPGVDAQGDFRHVEGYLSRSRKVLVSQQGAAASVAFPVRVDRRGYYEVFAWWPQAVAGAGGAQVSVQHVAGERQLQLDQRAFGGQWNSLGIFEFAPEPAGLVTFQAAGATPVIVDAVRYQFVSEHRPALSIRTSEMPVGLASQAYRALIESVGGDETVSYRITSGALPPGVQLDAHTGAVTGVPDRAGSYPVRLTARDAAGREAAREMTVVISESAQADAEPPPLHLQRQSGRSEGRSALAESGDLGGLLNIVAGMPEGGWAKVNLNSFSSVWTPADLRPLYGWSNPTPSKLILAWSSFAWDSNRGNLLLYGGGHANYRGNDVYLWRGSTRMWERASLPSEMVMDALGNWNAIDGPDHAPASAHTYDNTLFFPMADRMVVFGGAADANGGHYLRQDTPTSSRRTGIYLFDPAKADGNKVGGSTGSHVKRVLPYEDVVGGNMWANRESYLNVNPGPNEALVNGCAAQAVEGGRDVAYIRTANGLYKYQIANLADPMADRWEKVGIYWGGPGSKATCAYDPERKTLVRTATNSVPFVLWDLTKAGPQNRDVAFTPADPSGQFSAFLKSGTRSIADCALDFDPVRKQHLLWCGGGRTWALTPPETVSANGWSIAPQSIPSTELPSDDVGTGILGKWKYIDNLDAFMALQDSVEGNIWLYKPVGWRNPTGGNLPPTSRIISPQENATFASGEPIPIQVSASDSDGRVTRVLFYSGSTQIGETTAEPHTMIWTGAPVGSIELVAVAMDDAGATSASSAVRVSVSPPVESNQPPAVILTEPSDSATVSVGASVQLGAQASDPDGTVAKVSFFANGVLVGERSAAPYALAWTVPSAGTWLLKAVVTDNKGATATSASVSLTANAPEGRIKALLQRGAAPSGPVGDVYLSSYHKTLNFGLSDRIQDQGTHYTMLTRFAIFQSEGGPVPDGATIHSAVFSLYKYSHYDMVYQLYPVLVPWSEGDATWMHRQKGQAWAEAGANGAGSDYSGTPDAVAAAEFQPNQWLNFDVTAAVRRMASALPVRNYGWRILGTSGNVGNIKYFYSSESVKDISLRPKMLIEYEVGR